MILVPVLVLLVAQHFIPWPLNLFLGLVYLHAVAPLLFLPRVTHVTAQME